MFSIFTISSPPTINTTLPTTANNNNDNKHRMSSIVPCSLRLKWSCLKHNPRGNSPHLTRDSGSLPAPSSCFLRCRSIHRSSCYLYPGPWWLTHFLNEHNLHRPQACRYQVDFTKSLHRVRGLVTRITINHVYLLFKNSLCTSAGLRLQASAMLLASEIQASFAPLWMAK